MAHANGWILDVSIEQNRAIFWIRTTEGNIPKLMDDYQPDFYVLPKNDGAGTILIQILSQESIVKKIEWVHKFTDLFDSQDRGIKRLICVQSESTLSYNTLLKSLERDERVAQLYNVDLSHVQQYLFTTLKVEPTSKVEVDYDEHTSRLLKISAINEDGVSPPPFTILYFDITDSDGNQIKQIRARYQEDPDVSFEGDEETILKEFHDYVLTKDPDIVNTANQSFENIVVEYLFKKMGALGLDLGRKPSLQNHTNRIDKIKGRVFLGNKSFRSDLDLVGLIEKVRFGFLPLSLAARHGINRLIDSRNCYTLIQRGFVIPSRENNNNREPIRTLEQINSNDKGGMIFSLRVGLHENVAVLDYENEYANLIVIQNLSCETIPTTNRGGEERGLLPTVLEGVLRRRIFLKNLQKSFPVNTNEWFWCEQRIDALKNILVSLYGTTGSFWNRFANVEAFEEINRLSREILIRTKDILQSTGFELLYADTDSVFLKKTGASLEDFEDARDALERETGLPISLEPLLQISCITPVRGERKDGSTKVLLWNYS